MKIFLTLVLILSFCISSFCQDHDFKFTIVRATSQEIGDRVILIPDSLVKDKLAVVNFVNQRIEIFQTPKRKFTILEVAPSIVDKDGTTDVLKCIDEFNNGCRIYLKRPNDYKEEVTLGVQYSTITYIYWLKDL